MGAARVLQLVKPGGTDLAVIRKTLDLDTGLLSRLLRALEQEGLVEVTADPADRRHRIARLTPVGETEMQSYEKLGYAKAQQVLSHAGKRAPEVIAAMDLIASVMLRDQVEIRDADPDDPAAQGLLADYRQFLMDHVEGATAEMLPLPLPDAPKYRAPTGAFLVAWSDDLPVGCVSFRPVDNRVAEIKRLWVDPVARGQGLARRLMQTIEGRARDMGFAQVKLDTNSTLQEAVALYRATGWTETAAYTAFPADVWLAKPL